MNFLAHALLAEPGNDEFLFGNLVADGIRGSDLSGWPQAFAEGIRHHRRVDATVDHHPVVMELKRRIEGPRRRVAGIAFDIIWDHFLARDCVDQPRGRALIRRSYRVLEREHCDDTWLPVPDRLEATIRALCEQDWLSRYAEFGFTCQAIHGLGRRLSGPNHLAQLTPWLHEHYAVLETAFADLWPDMLALRSGSFDVTAQVTAARSAH